MANDTRNERRRFGHYVPIEVVQLFDAAADMYPQFTKQGFFEIVVIAGLNAISTGEFNWALFGQALEIQVSEQKPTPLQNVIDAMTGEEDE